MSISYEKAKQLLDDAVVEAQAKRDVVPWMRVVNTLLLDTLERLNGTIAAAKAINAKVVELRGGAPTAVGGAPVGRPPAPAPAAAPAGPRQGAVRMGADGQPMDDKQAAIEAEADAAFGPHPMDAAG